MYKKAFNRLPERFRKPNNELLYEVLYSGTGEIQSAIRDTRSSRNIDNAFGKTLDYIGENVGQLRTGEDDELFKLLIKTRIIANLSIGDIETINHVMSVLVKDVFLGVQEVWNIGEYDNEPVAIKIEIPTIASGIHLDIIHRIKAAAVRVIFEISIKEEIVIEEIFKDYKVSLYPIGKKHRCGTIHKRNKGFAKKSLVNINNKVEIKKRRIPRVGERMKGR